MQKLLVGEARYGTSQASYYLLEEEDSYGVQIEANGEEAAVPDLSPSRRRVETLAEALARGGVTPIALRDVVDDWLLE